MIKMKIFKIAVLSLSGLALFYGSLTRLINPTDAAFLQTYFVNPANSLVTDVDLVNEVRGVGAVMLFAGITAVFGAIRADFRQTSLVVTTVIFSGIVLGRSLSFLFDGIPNPNLIQAAIVEGVLAVLNILGLVSTLTTERQL